MAFFCIMNGNQSCSNLYPHHQRDTALDSAVSPFIASPSSSSPSFGCGLPILSKKKLSNPREPGGADVGLTASYFLFLGNGRRGRC